MKTLLHKDSGFVIPVIFEDENILVLNKPAGISVHGDGIRTEICVSDFILQNFPEMKDVGESLEVVLGTQEKTQKEKTEKELEFEARNFKTKKERFLKKKSKQELKEEVLDQNEIEKTLEEKKVIQILRPGIVHRLDKNTSGILILAKNNKTFNFLKEGFKEKLVKKQYVALVYGIPKQETGIIDSPIARSKADFRKKEIAVATKGKEKYRGEERQAQTRYKVLDKFILEGEKVALINFYPLTGRMHQIRVHSKSIGHPIVGDNIYGPYKKDLEEILFQGKKVGQLLHAESLTIDGITFFAEKPEIFLKALSIAKKL